MMQLLPLIRIKPSTLDDAAHQQDVRPSARCAHQMNLAGGCCHSSGLDRGSQGGGVQDRCSSSGRTHAKAEAVCAIKCSHTNRRGLLLALLLLLLLLQVVINMPTRVSASRHASASASAPACAVHPTLGAPTTAVGAGDASLLLLAPRSTGAAAGGDGLAGAPSAPCGRHAARAALRRVASSRWNTVK